MCTTLDMSYWVYGAYKTLRENMSGPNVFEEILWMRHHACIFRHKVQCLCDDVIFYLFIMIMKILFAQD